MIGDLIQHYRIVRQLGAGGMGVVYEAEDTRLGRHVAIKFLPETPGLPPEAIERFEREARLASSLNHPNICTIYDIGADGARRFIVMELLEGESLRSRIHGHPLPIALILDVGVQLADALDAAHAKGVVHRDIKPANILITKRGQAKLLDFGVAKLAGEPHQAADETHAGGDVLTTPGTAVGSINYMSPEQARGEELDGRTDLFSLGLVLYEMATGRQAFGGQTTAVVFDAILNRQPPDPRLMNPEIPEELQRVIVRALEKDRRMRFQTAADMLAEIGRIRRDTTGRTATAVAPDAGLAASSAVAQETAPARQPPPRSRSRWIAWAVPLLVVAIGAGYYFWRGTGAPALTENDTVLIADFVNTTGDAVFDDALKQAVFVQLQQTPFLTLMPEARVQQTLRLMQRPPNEAVTGSVAREVCQRAGAKATVEGSIAPLGSSYVLSLGVHNCATGAPLAQEQVQAASKEEVLAALGGAATSLRKRLGESLASIQKYDVPVTDATTKSLEALRAYGQGVLTRATKGDEASIPFFTQAIERDPDFALAYAKLGVVSSNLGRPRDARTYAEKAHALRDRVSEYERLYIDWNYAARIKQDPKAVREALEVLIAAYPRDFAARNNLGVYYNSRGEFEEALKQYQAAMEIAPGEPLPISNAAYALLYLGRLDEGSALVDRALAIRPNGNLAIARWLTAVIFNSPKTAEYEAAAGKSATPEQMLAGRAQYALWHGQLKAFRSLQEEAQARARAAHNDAAARGTARQQLTVSAVYEGGRYISELRSAAADEADPSSLAQMVATLAALGDPGPAREALPRLEKAAENDRAVYAPTAVAAAQVRAASGQVREAIATLDALVLEVPQSIDVNYFIGRMKESLGDVPGAISAYQLVIDSRAFLFAGPVVPMSRLALAELLMKQGNGAGAREQLDALLAQWKDADTEFPLLLKARALRKQSQ